MEGQNEEIAETCYQTIMNTTDINVPAYDEKMLISVIAATIEGIRKKQHKATKDYIFYAHEEFNGLDFELLEPIKMPDVEL